MRTESLAPPSQAKDMAARTLGYPSPSLTQASTAFTEPVNRCARYRPGTPASLTCASARGSPNRDGRRAGITKQAGHTPPRPPGVKGHDRP
jgi:hypothetical protein